MVTLSRPKLGLKKAPAASAPAASARVTPHRAAYLARAQAEKAAISRGEFWFIWSPAELAPKRRHPSLESALTEQARLRGLAPDREFTIYRAVAVELPGHEKPEHWLDANTNGFSEESGT